MMSTMMIAYPKGDLTYEKEEWWKVVAIKKILTCFGGSSFLPLK